MRFRALDQVSSVSGSKVMPKIFQICQEFRKDVQGISHIDILPCFHNSSTRNAKKSHQTL